MLFAQSKKRNKRYINLIFVLNFFLNLIYNKIYNFIIFRDRFNNKYFIIFIND